MTRRRATPQRLLYGRRHGRRLRPGRRELVERLLPRLEIVLPGDGCLDVDGLFGVAIEDIWLEIGFGAGEHLAAQARAHPEIGMIGCEPFINGVAGLLSHVAAAPPANLRIFADDARLLMNALPDARIGRMFALFPDPWPKTRHFKRRIVGPATLDAFARILGDAAELRLATDHSGYCRWMLYYLRRHPAFDWLARRPGDWRERPADWPATRYEEKARAQGLRPVFLRFRRHPRTRS